MLGTQKASQMKEGWEGHAQLETACLQLWAVQYSASSDMHGAVAHDQI
jgi:hypothetical protein